jgi:HEPN domain-containing protein
LNKVEHWGNLALMDFDAMLLLFDNGMYALALYHGQQCIEKQAKALCEFKNVVFKHTHNILSLLNSVSLTLTPEDIIELSTISSFNQRTRYDDETYEFLKQCNREYAGKWIETIKNRYEKLRREIK